MPEFRPRCCVDATAALGLGASLRIERVDRSGISCTKVHVLEDDHLAEAHAETRGREHAPAHDDAAHGHGHEHSHKHEHAHAENEAHAHGHSHSHEHTHDGVTHTHEHSHAHGRSLTAIRRLIHDAALAGPVKQTAIRAFELLGHAEAKIHNVPVEEIHFHEVGAVDAIVDIVAASAGIHPSERRRRGTARRSTWAAGRWSARMGPSRCPRRRPPTCCAGCPTYSAHVQQELVTPTGAALLRAIDPVFGPQPAMRVERIGYGAGTRNSKDFPNVLRVSVGEASETAERARGRTARR